MPSAELVKGGVKMAMSTLAKAKSKFIPEAERALQSGKHVEFAEDLAKKADRERTAKAVGDNFKETASKAGQLGKKGVQKAYQGTKAYFKWAGQQKNTVMAAVPGVAVGGAALYGAHKVHQGVSNLMNPTAHADSCGTCKSTDQQQAGTSSNLLKDGLLVGGGLLAGSALLGKSGGLGFLMKAGMLVLALNLLGRSSGDKIVNGLDHGLKSFENTMQPLLPNSTDAQVKANQGQNPDTKANLQTDLSQAGHAPSDGATQNYANNTRNQIGKVAGQNAPQAQNQNQNNKQLQTDGPETEL